MRLVKGSKKRGIVHCASLVGCMLLACTSPNSNDNNKAISHLVTISGTMPHGRFASALANADSIVAVLLDKGEFRSGWDKLPAATINPDGTFRLEIQKSSIDSTGNEVQNDWMLLLLNSKAPTRYEKVCGFVSLKEIDQSMIQFPLSRLKKDSINLGLLQQNGNEAVADTNANYDTTTFNMTIAQLRELAHTGQTLKMIKNSYGNWNPDKNRMIDIRPTYMLARPTMDEVKNRECKPSDYLDTSKISLNMQLFSADLQTFDYDQIHSGASSIDLYPPSQMYLEILDDEHTYIAPINQCFSTDTSVNPLIVYDSFGHTTRTAPVVIAAGGGSQHMSIIFSGFKGISPSGTWFLKKDKSTVLSQFDLGLGCPIDSSTGKPRIYVPSLNVSVNPADTTIQQIQLRWYFWDPSQNQYVQPTDEGLLQSSISYVSISLYSDTDSNNTIREEAACGSNPYFNESTSPTVSAVFTLTPTQKWIFREPAQPNLKFVLNVTWCTANQVFALQIAAMKK